MENHTLRQKGLLKLIALVALSAGCLSLTALPAQSESVDSQTHNAKSSELPTSAQTVKENKQVSVPFKFTDATDRPSVSESKFGNKTFAVGKILVNARPEQIWKILTDYNNAPDVFGNLQKCEVVEDKGRLKLVRQLVHPKGTPMNLDYIVEITETAPTLMEWHRKSGALKEVAGSWRLEQGEANGPTKVTYSIYLDGGLLLPAWLLRGQSKSYLPDLLNAIKQASEKDSRTAARKTGGLGVVL